MQYMIERRYGSRPNRDWLGAYGPGDQITYWTCGVHHAQMYPNITTANLMLDRVKEAAKAWDTCGFSFHVIEDRRHMPYYFASTEA